MRCWICFCLFASTVAPSCLSAAPVPERKYAKPAILKGEIESAVEWILESLPRSPGYAFFFNENAKASRLRIVLRHQDPKDPKAFHQWIKKNLRVERVRGTKQVRVSFLDGKPEEQALIINCIVDNFFKNDIDKRRQSETDLYERNRVILSSPSGTADMTPKEVAEAKEGLEKGFKERIRTLPVFVEHAKAR